MFMNLILMTEILILISMIIYIINMMISMIKPSNMEKMLPYECGFNPLTKPHLPFSLPFYLITLMFLVFDIEIIILIPMILYMKSLNSLLMTSTIIFMLILMIITLLSEILSNLLKWNS